MGSRVIWAKKVTSTESTTATTESRTTPQNEVVSARSARRIDASMS